MSQCATKEEVAAAREGKGDDMKESFEIGREGEEGCPNRWPSEGYKDEDIKSLNGNAEHDFWDKASEFRTAMQSFFLACQKLHKMIMRAIALGMKLEETFFDDFVQQGDNTLRLLHYPAVPKGGFDGGKSERAGAHTDYGTVTFLFQDERGGLQVEPPDGEIKEWKDVEPRKGTVRSIDVDQAVNELVGVN